MTGSDESLVLLQKTTLQNFSALHGLKIWVIGPKKIP